MTRHVSQPRLLGLGRQASVVTGKGFPAALGVTAQEVKGTDVIRAWMVARYHVTEFPSLGHSCGALNFGCEISESIEGRD
jgi:hypothetical protein